MSATGINRVETGLHTRGSFEVPVAQELWLSRPQARNLSSPVLFAPLSGLPYLTS